MLRSRTESTLSDAIVMVSFIRSDAQVRDGKTEKGTVIFTLVFLPARRLHPGFQSITRVRTGRFVSAGDSVQHTRVVRTVSRGLPVLKKAVFG